MPDKSIVLFWAKVRISDDCWEWTGATNGMGYGRLNRRGTFLAAHRFSYELANGSIPDGLSVCHRCDNPPCVRPDHLFLGSMQDNIRDSVAKRRSVGRHGRSTRLSEDDVRNIRQRIAQGDTLYAIAQAFAVSWGAVYDIRRRRSWGWLD
jgi:hypothetical protein